MIRISWILTLCLLIGCGQPSTVEPSPLSTESSSRGRMVTTLHLEPGLERRWQNGPSPAAQAHLQQERRRHQARRQTGTYRNSRASVPVIDSRLGVTPLP